MNILIGKLLVVILLSIATIVGLKVGLDRLESRKFTRLAWGTLALLRILVFVALFGFLNLTLYSDNVGYYQEAKEAVAGHLIYRDFSSSYGPLFTYFDGLAVWLWDSPKSIVLLAIVVEIACFPLWLYLGRRFYTENAARISAILYITSPLPFFIIGVNGLNQGLGAAYLAICIYFISINADFLAGIVAGMAVPGVKFLMALFAPVQFLYSRNRVRFVAGLVLVLAVNYGALVFMKANVLVPLRIQMNDQTPGNLIFVLGLLGLNTDTDLAKRLIDLFTLASLAIVFVIHSSRRSGRESLIPFIVLVGLTFMLSSKKSYPNYLVIFYFPLCMTVAASGLSYKSLGILILFNALATLEPSLYFRWASTNPGTISAANEFLATAHRNPLHKTIIFLATDLSLVGCYILYWWKASRAVVRTYRKCIPSISQLR